MASPASPSGVIGEHSRSSATYRLGAADRLAASGILRLMRVTNRETGEQLRNFEIGLNKSDIEALLPQLQNALASMTSRGDETGETLIGWTIHDQPSGSVTPPP